MKKKKSKKPSPNAVRRVQLFPDQETKKELLNWFGSVRSTYNWALGCIKNNNKAYKINAYWLRNRFINKVNIPKKKQWLLKTPKEVRYSAIVDLVQGYKLNFDKKRKDKSFTFDMKFRSKREHQSMTIPYTAIKWNTEKKTMKMYPTFLKSSIDFKCRNVPTEVNHDSKLVLDKLDRFYLCIPLRINRENQTDKDHDKQDWCSLDPGVRTFMPSPATKKMDRINQHKRERGSLQKREMALEIYQSRHSGHHHVLWTTRRKMSYPYRNRHQGFLCQKATFRPSSRIACTLSKTTYN